MLREFLVCSVILGPSPLLASANHNDANLDPNADQQVEMVKAAKAVIVRVPLNDQGAEDLTKAEMRLYVDGDAVTESEAIPGAWDAAADVKRDATLTDEDKRFDEDSSTANAADDESTRGFGRGGFGRGGFGRGGFGRGGFGRGGFGRGGFGRGWGHGGFGRGWGGGYGRGWGRGYGYGRGFGRGFGFGRWGRWGRGFLWGYPYYGGGYGYPYYGGGYGGGYGYPYYGGGYGGGYGYPYYGGGYGGGYGYPYYVGSPYYADANTSVSFGRPMTFANGQNARYYYYPRT